jgi:WD40 repeat protein
MDDKKIISACLDHRLSAHKLLPNDIYVNNVIEYCLISSNMNSEKEDITSLLQIDENSFVSSSSMDLNDDPSIKFWRIENDNFKLEKAIYDIYCCQYANTICKVNDNILGFALEYASLSGKEGGLALADINNKDIFAIVKGDNITCLTSISNNRFFACSYDKNDKKRYIKEYMMNRGELEEKYKLEVHHDDDIINIELIKESDLMVISSDDGKITVFDNYST